MTANMQEQTNILTSTIEVIPQQVKPVQQHCELLPRVLVVVVVLVFLVVVEVGVGIGAPVATATDEEDDRGCGDGGCGGLSVE